MENTTFDLVTRAIGASMSRRTALRGLFAGAATTVAGGTLLPAIDVSAKRRRGKKKAKKVKASQSAPPSVPPPPPPPPPDPLPEPNPCEEKNWCLDRTQTCGPAGGYGKCLVEAGGGNICAEILFQVPSCAECEAPNCTNCRCVLAAGGGDRCNNGATGYDFICVRTV
jgi:hypothetical protein